MKKNAISFIALVVVLISGVVFGSQFILAFAGLTLLSIAFSKIKTNNYIQAASFAVLGVFAIISAIVPELSFGVMSTGGVLSAVTPVIGTQSVQSADDQNRDDLFVRDVEDTVFMIGRDDFPLSTMQRELNNSKPLKAKNAEWYEDAYYDREDTIGAEIAAPQAPTSGLNTITLGAPEKFVEGNIIGIPGGVTETNNNPSGELRAFIQSINYDTGVASVRVLNNGSSGLPILEDTTKIYRLFIAGSEMQAQAPVRHREADRYTNNIQRFIGQVETSDLRQLLNTFTGDDGQREQKKQVYDFRNSIEYANLFGISDETLDAKNETITLQGGIEQFAKGYIEYTRGAINQTLFNTWCKQIFTGNNGSRQRLLLVDEMLMLDILNVGSVDKTLASKETELVLGVKVNKVETSFGTLMIKVHKGFAEVGREYYGMAIDMPNISDRILKPFNAYELNLKKSGQKNAKAIFMEEWKSLRVANGASHTLIYGVTG